MSLGKAFPTVLAGAREGSEWAWTQIHREFAGPVTGYLAGRGAREPEDVASETFLQVANGIGSFEGDEAAFRSWVFVIAHRRMLDDRRAVGRRPRSADVDPATLELAGGNAEGEALANIASGDAQALLEDLSDDQRNVLLLRIVGGFSVAETAAITGKRSGAVKTLQHRALAALRARIPPDL